jgi:hypothetical protein
MKKKKINEVYIEIWNKTDVEQGSMHKGVPCTERFIEMQ